MQHDGTYFSQLESKLKTYGLSAAGAHFVQKALHPPVGAATRIPDSITVSALNPEYKTETQITMPPAVTTSTWDLLILIPPSDRLAMNAYAGNAATNFYASAGVGAWGPVHTGLATSPVAMNLVLSDPTTGAISGNYVAQTSISADCPAMWRTSARSTTVYYTGSDLYGQGTCFAGQYARKTYPSTGWVDKATSGGYTALNQDLVDLPLSEVDMAIITPGLYTAPAKEGVYTVARLTGPCQEFSKPRQFERGYDGTAIVTATGDFSGYSDPSSGLAGTLFRTMATPENSFATTGSAQTRGTPWCSTSFDQQCTWGVVLFRGLHPSMTFTVKTIVNLEIVPLGCSPTRQFVQPALRYEPAAMNAYYAIADEVATTMAARHNFLGTLLPALSAVASKVWPVVAPALGSLASSVAARLAPAPAPPPPPMVKVRRSGSRASTRSRVSSVRSAKKVKIAKRKKRR